MATPNALVSPSVGVQENRLPPNMHDNSHLSVPQFLQTYGPSLNKSSSTSDSLDIHAEEVVMSSPPQENEQLVSAPFVSENEESLFFWELLLYVPILFQSLFGTLHILRSLLLGHALGWFLQQVSLRAPHWLGLEHLEMFLRKMDTRNAWPPPALLFLILFTITALVVHPDGFTWLFLRKLRDTMISVFRASCVCWSMVVQEHGAIISTILALATFASLFFLSYALHKTLTPRTNLSNHGNKALPTKKKKRKGGSHGRGHRFGRTRTSAQQRDRTEEEHAAPSEPHDDSSSLLASEKKVRTTEQSDDPQEAASEISAPQPVLPAVLEDLPVEPPPIHHSDSLGDAVALKRSLLSTLRDRTMSNSTMDSASTVDTACDQSCGSLSDRSVTPSCTAESSFSSQSSKNSSLPLLPLEALQSKVNSSSKKKTSPPQASSLRKNQNRRGRGRKLKDHVRSKENSSRVNSSSSSSSVTPSRWDALKPDNRTDLNHQRRPPVHSPRTTNSNMKNNNVRSPMIRNSSSPLPINDNLTVTSLSCMFTPASPSTVLLGSCETGVSQWRPDAGTFGGAMNSDNLTNPLAFSPSTQNRDRRHLYPDDLRGPTLLSPIAPKISSDEWINNFKSSNMKDDSRYLYLRSMIPAPPGLAPIHPPLTATTTSTTCSSLPGPGFLTAASSSLPDYSLLPMIADPPAPARRCVIKANPFATDDDEYPYNNNAGGNNLEDDQIEADLQELGGRMVGSILDF